MQARTSAPPFRPTQLPPGLAIQRRNRALLNHLGRSRQRQARLRWRNALVVNNLSLVRMVAQKESHRTGQPFDDLCSAGYEGLVRAVESFDTARGVSLSSYVVPCVRGAMLQDRRDRQQPLQTPRRLRDLHRKAERLLEHRRAHGHPALDPASLVEALGCTAAQLEEAGRVHRALQLCSLDAPMPGGTAEGDGPTRLEQLRDPATEHAALEGSAPHDPQLRWLRQRLARLEPDDRRLMEGHWLDGLSWSELAGELGLSGRICRQRGDRLLARLQSEATAGARPMASNAAKRV